MSSLPRTIAIDGPAASGKSILAEQLANALGYFNFDTGLMYRAVTDAALTRTLSIQDEGAVARPAQEIVINVLPASDKHKSMVMVDGKDVTARLHRPDVDRNVSAVSSYQAVRRVMAEQQRRIAEHGNIVMAGRDIGTVVLPNAECKIYLTASVDREHGGDSKQRVARGQRVTFEEMRDEILARDAADSSRQFAPLRAADNAVLLDNSDMTIEATVERALEIIRTGAAVPL